MFLGDNRPCARSGRSLSSIDGIDEPKRFHTFTACYYVLLAPVVETGMIRELAARGRRRRVRAECNSLRACAHVI